MEWKRHEETLDRPARSAKTQLDLRGRARRELERRESFYAGAHAVLALLHQMTGLSEESGAEVLVMLERESRLFVAGRLRARIQKGTVPPEAIRLVEGPEAVGGAQC